MHRNTQRRNISDLFSKSRRQDPAGLHVSGQCLFFNDGFHARFHVLSGPRVDASDDDRLRIKEIDQDRQKLSEIFADLVPECQRLRITFRRPFSEFFCSSFSVLGDPATAHISLKGSGFSVTDMSGLKES